MRAGGPQQLTDLNSAVESDALSVFWMKEKIAMKRVLWNETLAAKRECWAGASVTK